MQPHGHLLDVLLLIGGSVATLCVVDVQAFSALSVVPVSCADVADGERIVECGVKLGDVVVLADAFPDEYVLVLMECRLGSLEKGE